MNAVKKEWNARRSLWLSFHYRNYIGRKESLENVQLLMVKRDVLRCLGENSTCCMIIISDLQKVSVSLVERKLRGIEFVMRCRWFRIWSKPCTVWLYDMFNVLCLQTENTSESLWKLREKVNPRKTDSGRRKRRRRLSKLYVNCVKIKDFLDFYQKVVQSKSICFHVLNVWC